MMNEFFPNLLMMLAAFAGGCALFGWIASRLFPTASPRQKRHSPS
ncbi:hypothetical protein [Gluconobacter cerinus]|nr:hypothetical protein [Gluconobacter cerinus]